jgi:hypothetical protein
VFFRGRFSVTNTYPQLELYCAAVLLIMIAWVLVVKFVWKSKSKLRSNSINASLTVFSLAIIWILIEFSLAHVFIYSDGFGKTLGGKRWRATYSTPINSHGMRDREPDLTKRMIYLVGDSFAWGSGIRNIDNRFGNILGNKIGDDYSISNLSKGGAHTGTYLSYIKTFSAKTKTKPEKIITSYFINDIIPAAKAAGVRMPRLDLSAPSGFWGSIVSNSYVANLVYWRIRRMSTAWEGNKYQDYILESYSNEKAMALHKIELDAIVNEANEMGAKLYFIVWPTLADIKVTEEICDVISRYLRSKGVEVLNIADHFDSEDPSKYVNSSLDAHPNALAHAKAAELLYNLTSPW